VQRALKAAPTPVPGRPKHDTLTGFADDPGLWAMWCIHRATGERRPYSLAGLAIAAGHAHENAREGLARAWRRASDQRKALALLWDWKEGPPLPRVEEGPTETP